MRMDFNLWLDTYSNDEQYSLYRSSEENGYHGRPIIDGVYIWRPALAEKLPNNMKLTLESRVTMRHRQQRRHSVPTRLRVATASLMQC